jgi:DNA-binding transcriptional MerR regulator
MPLILTPSIKDNFSREDIEAYIEQVRARRMIHVVEFHNLANAKIEGKSVKITARMQRQLELLQKELDALERAEQKVEGRMSVIDSLSEELGLLQSELVDVTPVED